MKRNGFRAKEKKKYYKIGNKKFVESSNWDLTPD